MKESYRYKILADLAAIKEELQRSKIALGDKFLCASAEEEAALDEYTECIKYIGVCIHNINLRDLAGTTSQ